MTVSAYSAKVRPGAASIGFVPMREGTRPRAGTFEFSGDDLVTGWHHHDLHQVEYALSGVAEVETKTGHYLLPPQQAMWIPAGLEHTTTLCGVRSVSVFFEPDMVTASGERARVLAAAPVIREMITYGLRWPITRPVSDERADAFFTVLADLLVEWLDQEAPLWLPTSDDPLVAEVMEHTRTNLRDASEQSVCRTVGISERTLRRRFAATAGLTWRTYLCQARLLRASALLADPAMSVLDVSVAVGFDSPSAFTRAFRNHTGESPSAYRRRCVPGAGFEPARSERSRRV